MHIDKQGAPKGHDRTIKNKRNNEQITRVKGKGKWRKAGNMQTTGQQQNTHNQIKQRS